MKKCFTINPFRSTEEIASYHQLLADKVYQAIEIFYPYELDENGFKQYQKNIEALLVYQPEVVMHLPFGKKSDLCNMGTFEEVLARIKEAINFAKRYQVKKFTLHLGYVNGQNREVLFLHLVETLKDLCDFATPGVMMIENMPGSEEMGYSPEEIINLIKEVNRHNLKFIFDTGHANVSEYALEDYLHTLYPFLMHIHLSDNHGLRDEHAPIGSGNIDFKKLLSLLTDYRELFCLEILYHTVNDLKQYAIDLDSVNP
jgi:sugar phosphate isomerase/epimerase